MTSVFREPSTPAVPHGAEGAIRHGFASFFGAPVVEDIAPRGIHGLDPQRPEMQAGFVVAGPGVAAGAALGAIRQIDVAPTLAALLGLDPPAQATGRVLTDALAKPPHPSLSPKGERAGAIPSP